MDVHSEIEIKLTGDVDKLHEIIQSSKLSPFIKWSCRKNYQTYYYDTKDNSLIKNNIVIRKRKLEENRNILGLKWRDPGSSLFERGEIEVGIQNDKFDLRVFGEIWNQKIFQIIGNSEIEQKFCVVVQREIYKLSSGETLIEISIDKGEISSTNKKTEIKEIELELKTGQVSILYDLAINFVEKLQLSIELESKAERGFLLEDKKLRKYFYKTTGISDKSTDPEVFVTNSINILVKQFAVQIKNLSDDFYAEDIHQTRVVLRRIRVIFFALRRISSNNDFDLLNNEARRMAALLGKVREYDVLESLIESVPRDHINNDNGINELILQIRMEKEQSLELAKKIISEGMAAIFVIKLERLINKQGYLKSPHVKESDNEILDIGKMSSFILTKIERRVKKRGSKLKYLHDIGRHQLRIDLKKLRYLTDFFSPIYEKKTINDYIKHVSELQEYLGVYNDIVNAEILLQKTSINLSHSAQFTAGKILGWHVHANLISTKKLFKRWKKFCQASDYWT